jgi:NitT/TauT family transport system substrate-binding protein
MKRTLLYSFLLLSLILSACGGVDIPVNQGPAVVQAENEGTTPEGPVEPVSLKIAVLPILDALPMHVALEKGYFADHNLDVELVPVTSAPERDQLMQAGQIDGMINELVSTMFYNQNGTQIVIVRFARTATPDSPVFRILASAESGITRVEDLAGVEIGVSEGTVIEYITDRLLENAGLAPEDIVKVAVPRIPDRLNLLQSGELAAGVLPDPVASLAVANGAIVIVDDSSLPEVGASVISFSIAAIEEHPEAVAGFLAALEMAVDDLNANPSEFTGMMGDLGMVPPPLLESFELPPFVTASVPSEAQFADALQWVLDKGLIANQLNYADSVDPSFLP